MILANVFCLLFFLGEYLRAGRAACPPEPGGPRGTARSVAGEKPGTRGASGARAGDRRGERAAERAGPPRCRIEPGRAARQRAEGREPPPAGYAGGLGRRLGTPSPHTRTLAYSHTMLALISLKIMGSNCGNLRKKNTNSRSGREEGGERLCVAERKIMPVPAPGSARADGMGFWISCLDIGAGSAGCHPLTCQPPFGKCIPLPAPRAPFPVAPLPGTLFKFLPTLCPPSGPDPSQMRGQE